MKKWELSIAIIPCEGLAFVGIYFSYLVMKLIAIVEGTTRAVNNHGARSTNRYHSILSFSSMASQPKARKISKGVLTICCIMVVMRGVLTCLQACSTGLIAYYSSEASVSPSVMLSMVSLSSFTTALAFYFLYNERLLFTQMGGMAIIIFSIVIIAVSKSFRL